MYKISLYLILLLSCITPNISYGYQEKVDDTVPLVVTNEPKIVGIGKNKEEIPPPSIVNEGKMVKLKIINAPKTSVYIVDLLPLNVADIDVEDNIIRFTSKASNMPFYLRCWIVADGKTIMLDHSVVINDHIPTPPNPLDPPGPGPKPVDPPKPVAKDEFRVLVLTEMDDVGKLPASQAAALYSGKFYEFLNENCIKDKDNRPDWRFLDDDLNDTEIAKMEPYWQETYKKAKADALAAGTSGQPLYPWVVFSNPGKKDIGEAGPFPKTPEKALEEANKWAPTK